MEEALVRISAMLNSFYHQNRYPHRDRTEPKVLDWKIRDGKIKELIEP